MANREGNAGDRTGADGPSVNDAPLDAAGWFARMRSPDADHYRAAFETWHADPGNVAAYARAKENWLLLGGIAPEHLAAHQPSPPRPARKGWALAAALVLGLSLGIAWVVLGANKDPVLVAAKQTGDIRLDDGTIVTLSGGAHITPRFTDSERRVLLTGSGRARFSVAHDATRPFRVEAAGSETTALGTIFEIDLSKPLPLVHLLRGSVEVRVIASGAAPVRLRPGQYAEATQAGARLIASDATDRATAPVMQAPVAAAGSGDAPAPTLLVADNMPLADVLQYANERNGVQLRLADPALGRRPVTGRFDVSDAASLARKLAAALDLELSEDKEMLFLGARKEKTRG